ncbi:MAG: ATP-binding protein [Elusimicrobia bacterium]|nr:ATP-binding protein [Elusimicrobiota bacterium]MBU2615375.1 ATP-binding protein [Elusimicrobiota bacterium]
MDNELVKRYINDWNERVVPTPKERETRLRETSRIQTVIGARRVGKTSLLYDKIRDLITVQKVPKEQILFLNLEDPLLDGVTFQGFKKILEIHWSLFPQTTSKKLYLFIDEPQVVTNWEKAVLSLHNEGTYELFITGSSSKLLSKEIATSLRGKTRTTILYPLSFREFCAFKGQSFDASRISTKQKAALMHAIDLYLQYGGYPEVVLEDDEVEKTVLLKDFFDLTIYKDIIDRYAIKNTTLVRWLINYMVSCATKEISINKVFNTLKSSGQKVSKNTLYEYFSILEDCFFITTLRKLDRSVKNEGMSIPKVFLNDVGFLSLFSDHDYGKRLENTVAIELMRRKAVQPLMSINYWKSKEGKEVDFIVSEGKKVIQAIQVCFAFNDPSTRERELSALAFCLEHYGLKDGLVITRDYESIQHIGKKTIHVLPVWKWLLSK